MEKVAVVSLREAKLPKPKAISKLKEGNGLILKSAELSNGVRIKLRAELTMTADERTLSWFGGRFNSVAYDYAVLVRYPNCDFWQQRSKWYVTKKYAEKAFDRILADECNSPFYPVEK